MATVLPTSPAVGFILKTLGGPRTVKINPLLAVPATITITGPVPAPEGTVVEMLVELELVTVAGNPLKVTVLAPGVELKSAPIMVTGAPTGPSGGVRLNMDGTFVTVKLAGLLGTFVTVAMTFPVMAPVGTVAVMFVADQVVTFNAVPFNVIVLLP